MRLLIIALLATLGAATVRAAEPVKVMIVGDFHMGNPGRDLHNVQVPDMLSPKNQAEIASVDEALSRFRPTAVVAEWSAQTVGERFPKYLDGSLPPTRNEVVQLGFRLAKATNARMAGIDVDGEFPYDAVETFAKAHGRQTILEEQGQTVQAMVDAETHLLNEKDVAAALRYLNDPERLKPDNGFYRAMLKIGDGTNQPGAELDTAWYRRNLFICANLVQLATPGDRIVVFYGSGHAFLLRQCVAETPGFSLVEPNDYLPR